MFPVKAQWLTVDKRKINFTQNKNTKHYFTDSKKALLNFENKNISNDYFEYFKLNLFSCFCLINFCFVSSMFYLPWYYQLLLAIALGRSRAHSLDPLLKYLFIYLFLFNYLSIYLLSVRKLFSIKKKIIHKLIFSYIKSRN